MHQTDINKILKYKDSILSFSRISEEVFGTKDKRKNISNLFKKLGIEKPSVLKNKKRND